MTTFPKYARYKDSGVDSFGDIPEGWEVQPICAISKLKSVRDFPDRELLSVYLGHGVIKFSDVDEKRTNATSTDLSSYQAVDPGDLVLNNQQAWRGSVGVSKHEGIVSPAYIILSLSERWNPAYANYLFRDSAMVSQYLIYSKGVGTIQRNLYYPDFKRASVILPPKYEQDRIVAFLDQKTAEIDALIAKKQRQIELLDEQKAILINRAVTRGLNPNTKLKPSGIEWIPEIPSEWDILPLKRVAKVQGGYAFPAQAFGKVGIPVIRMSNLKRGSVDLSEVACVPESLDHPRYRLREGDLCYGLSGSVGATGSLGNYAFVSESDLPCLLNQRVARFVPQVDKISSAFLALIIQTSSFYSQVLLKTTGTAQFNVSTGDVEGALVQLPPLTEQLQIVAAINKIETGTARVMSSVGDQIQSLKTLRSTLIAHAVTGRIKV